MSRELTIRIAFLDVGEGDTIVVTAPETGEAVIVDCADADSTLQYLQRQGITHIRALIVTHLHLDHYKGVVQFLNNCESQARLTCERVIFNWPNRTTIKYELLRDGDRHSDVAPDEKANRRQTKDAFQGFKLWTNSHKEICGPLTVTSPVVAGHIGQAIELMHPWHGQVGMLEDHGLNNLSGIVKVRGPGTAALLTGDIEYAGWQELQATQGNLQCDVFKFPHHGAWKNADPDDLLDAVRPSIVVISVGSDGSRYNHPNPHVLASLKVRTNIQTLCTEATNACAADILSKRTGILEKFASNGNGADGSIIVSDRGCPCAGTVVIELGATARVIEPDVTFHNNVIVQPYFGNRQCATK